MWSWLENLDRVLSWLYEAFWLFLLQCAVVAKTWIECEFVAKASIEHEVVAKAWIKHVVVAKAWIKHKLSRKPIHVYYSFWLWKKNNPARRAGEKNNLAPKLSEKNFLARKKIPSPPQNIKWTVPNRMSFNWYYGVFFCRREDNFIYACTCFHWTKNIKRNVKQRKNISRIRFFSKAIQWHIKKIIIRIITINAFKTSLKCISRKMHINFFRISRVRMF